ncbi:hypothetical protein [Kitasatospora sp. NPDC093558]|uniref:hypothetical protein n=1 Tax=Kitasatospora sp. NPDC093558 TaxID=3155201 RepID=UPI00342F5A82
MINVRGQANGQPDRQTGDPTDIQADAEADTQADGPADSRTIVWTAPERWTFFAALAVMAVLVLLAVIGQYNSHSGGYLVLQQWFDRPLLLWTLGIPALMAAVITAPWWAAVRILLATAVGLLAAGTLMLWLFNWTSTVVNGTQDAPGRTDRRIVAEETGWALDSTKAYYVDEGTGLTTRRWLILAQGPHDPYDRAVRWSGPDRIQVDSDAGTITIDLAADGRPSRELHFDG